MDISQQQFEEEFKKQYPIKLTDSDIHIKEIAFKFWQASRNIMKPAGYLSPSASVCLGRGKKTIISPESQNNYIPLYRLDK